MVVKYILVLLYFLALTNPRLVFEEVHVTLPEKNQVIMMPLPPLTEASPIKIAKIIKRIAMPRKYHFYHHKCWPRKEHYMCNLYNIVTKVQFFFSFMARPLPGTFFSASLRSGVYYWSTEKIKTLETDPKKGQSKINFLLIHLGTMT